MIALAVTLLLSIFLCWLYLMLARHRQWLDRPNERSSHRTATPHGGGAALLLAFMVEGVYRFVKKRILQVPLSRKAGPAR